MSEIIIEEQKATLKLSENIVASQVDAIKDDLKQILSTGVTDLTLDLSEVMSMDSMGIGILIATHNTLKKKDNRLNLIGVSSDILKLLRTMRLHEHFNIIE